MSGSLISQCVESPCDCVKGTYYHIHCLTGRVIVRKTCVILMCMPASSGLKPDFMLCRNCYSNWDALLPMIACKVWNKYQSYLTLVTRVAEAAWCGLARAQAAVQGWVASCVALEGGVVGREAVRKQVAKFWHRMSAWWCLL